MKELEDKLNNYTTELKVLEQKVQGNKEIADIRLQSYKNYAIITLALLTAIGTISIWSVIKDVVKESSEAKLNEILTEKYIEKKIRERSEKTIQELISETVQKSTAAIEKSYTLRDWQLRANEAVLVRDYVLAAKYYSKAKDKILLFPHRISSIEISDTYLSISEIFIFQSNYSDAFKTLRESDKYIKDEVYNNAIYLFLYCVTNKLLETDYSHSEKELNKLLETRPNINWDFIFMKDWLSIAKISKMNREFIWEKIALIEQSLKE